MHAEAYCLNADQFGSNALRTPCIVGAVTNIIVTQPRRVAATSVAERVT